MDSTFIEYLIKVGLAVLIGGSIGAEREFQDRAAGIRTILLITVVSVLFTIISLRIDVLTPRKHYKIKGPSALARVP